MAFYNIDGSLHEAQVGKYDVQGEAQSLVVIERIYEKLNYE